MKQRLFSPKVQRRWPVTNVFHLEITSPCKDPLFLENSQWSEYDPREKKWACGYSTPVLTSKGWNEHGTWSLVQNTGWDRSGQKCPGRFSVRCCNKPKWSRWPIRVSVFQGQESSSGLNNFHDSGLFCNSTPPSSTSQPYCGHRTLILQKCSSQTIIHKVPSLMHRGFLMAQWEISNLWGKTDG